MTLSRARVLLSVSCRDLHIFTITPCVTCLQTPATTSSACPLAVFCHLHHQLPPARSPDFPSVVSLLTFLSHEDGCQTSRRSKTKRVNIPKKTPLKQQSTCRVVTYPWDLLSSCRILPLALSINNCKLELLIEKSHQGHRIRIYHLASLLPFQQNTLKPS